MTNNKTTAKVTKTTVEKAYEALNTRVTALEKLVEELKAQRPRTRKVREYTDEERKIIRARLLAEQEAARKRREAEA